MADGRQEHQQQPGPLSPSLCHDKDPSDRELLERFIRRGDQQAFALVVRRHGPMVLGVCQRVLNHSQDAEDAFQATFLVLVRKAGSLARPELLANWLYGVAYRIARKARASALRRRNFDLEVACMTPVEPRDEAAWSELRGLLDEELHRLPDKYRAPVVLCDLEGKTHLKAAEILGWPSGSISSRLARGREMLRQRLVKRNCALPVGLFAILLARNAVAVTVSEQLLGTTVRAALALARGGRLAGGSFSSRAQKLAEGASRAMSQARFFHVLGVSLLVLGLSLGAGVLTYAALPSGPARWASEGGSGDGCHGASSHQETPGAGGAE
jgi:RNA polymerase sigma factor (sigma-70 family)